VTIRRIMIVDDDEDICRVTELAMRRIGGWEVVSVTSGEEALLRGRDERPDVILLDATMPGLDGPATLAKLRKEPTTAAIPVIFLTARVQRHDLARYRALGACGVIQKPFDAAALPEEIRRIVAGRSVADAELDAALRRLREAYRRKLPELLRMLGERVCAARLRHDTPDLREAARQLAHRLKGTCGCYELYGPSATLERVEELLAVQGPAAWAELERALERAREALGISSPPAPSS
jgi:CheY-like chemotaxis protein